MIPPYLDNLHIDQVFSLYTSDVEAFIRESTVNEHIVDSEKNRVSGFVTDSFGREEEENEEFFLVENPSGKPFSLLQIDNGLIRKNIGPATKKCDCAIVDDISFCFIEFKTKANTLNPLRRDNNYKVAIEQLSATIGLFDNYHATQGTDIRDLRDVEAYICFRQGYPRKTSSQMKFQVSFADKHRIPLLFARTKQL